MQLKSLSDLHPGLEWESIDRLELYAPPPTAMTASAFLASRAKLFEDGRVFVEATRTDSSDSNLLLVKGDDTQFYLSGDQAKSVAGSITPETLRGLDFRCFVAATSRAHIVSPRSAVLYRTPAGGELDPMPQRVEVNPDRFVACSKTASTVGATLRANGIYYAAARAVYVRVTNFDNPEALGDKLVAFPESKDPPVFLWKGWKLAMLVEEENFRAAFKIYAPCRDAWQQLAPGMTVLLDIENLSPVPSPEEKIILVRYYPEAGEVDPTTSHHTTISAAGVRVRDIGYPDDEHYKGFRRGWVGTDLYWRVVGDHPNCFISGGTVDHPYKFNIRKEHDLGYDNKRVVIKLPHEGFVYCRGVGEDGNNPTMACVLFDRDGNVRDKYGHMGHLGRWKDMFQ